MRPLEKIAAGYFETSDWSDMLAKQFIRTFSSRAYKTLIYIFAALGLFDLCGRLLILPLAGSIYGYAVELPMGTEISRVIPSADKSLKAIVYLWTGSGLNPGCSEFVSIVEGFTSDTTGWEESNRVFQRDCGNTGNLNLSWEPPANGRVQPRLRIKADPAKADFMSRFGRNGTVAVAYQNDP